MNQPDNRVLWLRVAAGIAVVGVLALLSPALVSAAQGVEALGEIAVIGVLGLAGIQALPFAGQWLENRLLMMRKAEARQNPIEQMQNNLMHKAQQIQSFKEALTSINSQIQGMRSMLDNRKKQRPGQDLSAEEAAYARMSEYYQMNVVKLQAAKKALDEYDQSIKDAIFKWEFAQAGKKAMASMNATDQEAVLKDILSNEAIRSVQDNFNQAFAAMDLEVATMNSQKSIEYAPGVVLDLSSIQIPATVPAIRS